MALYSLRSRVTTITLAFLVALFSWGFVPAQPVLTLEDQASPALPMLATPLPAPLITDFMVRSGEVRLIWNTVIGALEYNVYRSSTSGTGYVKIGKADSFSDTTTTQYLDKALTDGTPYYYVVTSVDNQGGESWFSNEVLAIPHVPIEWAGTILPGTTNITLGQDPEPKTVYAEVYIDSQTGPMGPATEIGLKAQLGYGPIGTAPAGWSTWIDATYAGYGFYNEANDRYQAHLMIVPPGLYDYAFRFSLTGGVDWVYADRMNLIQDPTQPIPDDPEKNDDGPGRLVVAPSDDTVPPSAPTGLVVTDVQYRSVGLSWSAVANEDLYGYEIFRSTSATGPFESIGTIVKPATSYTDRKAVAGTLYYYRVQAFDLSYNHSTDSNTVQAETPSRTVKITLRAAVPAFTPGQVFYSRCLVSHNLVCDQWDTGPGTMTQNANWWTAELPAVQDGTPLMFYFHRGNPQTTGQAMSDGDTLPALTAVTAEYGTTGVQEITRIVTNWRDPIVVSYTPSGNSRVSPFIPFTVTWNQPMPPSTDFLVKDGQGRPVAGNFQYNASTYTTTFIPTQAIPIDTTLTAEVSGKTDLAGEVQQVPVTWTVVTGTYSIWSPMISKP